MGSFDEQPRRDVATERAGMTSDDELHNAEGASPPTGLPGDEPAAAPSSKYYRSTSPSGPIVYVQEADRWHSSIPGGAVLRQEPGTIPDEMMGGLEEMDETQAKSLLQTAPLVRDPDALIPAEPAINRPAHPSGLGGWMVLPIVMLFLTLAVSLTVLFASQLPLFRSEVWSELTTSGTAAYHPLWGPMIVFETFATAVMIVFPILLLVLIFRKRRAAPKFVIGFAFFILLAKVVDSLAVVPLALDSLRHAGYLDTAHDTTTTALTGLVTALVLAAVWIPYFFLSTRVRNTFVHSRATEGTPAKVSARRSRLAVAWTLGVGVTASIVLIVLLSWGTATLSREIGGLTTQSGGIKTYTDPTYGFSFSYPADWVLQTSGTAVDDAANVPLGAAAVFDPEGTFDGAYAVDIATVATNLSGFAFKESMLPDLKTSMEAYVADPSGPFATATIIEPLSQTTLGGLSGFKVTFSDTTDDTQDTRVIVTLYSLFSGTLEYDLVVQTATEDWQDYQATYDALLSAFKPGPER
jgi:hypothetical protein